MNHSFCPTCGVQLGSNSCMNPSCYSAAMMRQHAAQPDHDSARVRELETLVAHQKAVISDYVHAAQERDALRAELQRCEERKRGWKDLVESLRAELDRAKRVVEAARELVRLKTLKDGVGKTEEYHQSVSRTWMCARDALLAYDQAAPDTGGKDGG